MAGTLDIRNFTRRKTPGLPLFTKAAQDVLPGWDISLVFAGERRAQQLNYALRRKEYVPNVLSYEVSEARPKGKSKRNIQRSGEIIICPSVADKQAAEYGLTKRENLLYLFIHGLYHLKGLRHGATMERYERALLARLVSTSSSSSLNGTTHSNRN